MQNIKNQFIAKQNYPAYFIRIPYNWAQLIKIQNLT